MNTLTATNFLDIAPGWRFYYTYRIEALDLQSRARIAKIPGPTTLSPYLDVEYTPIKMYYVDDYVHLLEQSLENFIEKFKTVLFKELGGIPKKDSVDEREFFDLLENTKPDELCENILCRYMLVHLRTDRYDVEERTVQLFENVSTVLLKQNYKNSLLCIWLVKSVSYRNKVHSSILCHTDSSEKFDYILYHMQSFYRKNECPYYFIKFKNINSILGCVRFGRLDMLRVLLKYGSWKLWWSEQDIWEELWEFMDNTYFWCSGNILTVLKLRGYDMKRYILILQICKALMVPTHESIRYLSTIQLFWKSLPYPYITVEEMKQALTETRVLITLAHVRRVCAMYTAIWRPRKFQPRTLKHYARCVVRSTFDQVCRLPDGIEDLELPKEICSYLRLQD